ncbi:MAG: type VII toxin-antitoxin system MntA family adenylyltransferase antitoxin [Actinomycetota bacterium]
MSAFSTQKHTKPVALGNLDDLVRALRRCPDAEPDVLVAYLFGSWARGKSGPLSDVDIAVLLNPESDPWKRRLALLATVAQVVGSEKADVVILNEASVDLGYRVLRDGIVLVSKDEPARIGHWVRTVDRYLDMAPFRRTIAEGLSNRIREGKFGRR